MKFTATSIGIRSDPPEISKELTMRWQKILDLLSRILDVPAALVMRVLQEEIEVFARSDSKGNPYHPGERANLATGLYCETVMEKNTPLEVPNALKDPMWENNPDVKLNMIHYFGLPFRWPDGEMFGTLCVLDNKERIQSDLARELLTQFRDVMEMDLVLLDTIMSLQEAKETIDTLKTLVPICARCKRIQDENGNWEEVESFMLKKKAVGISDLSHTLCPICYEKTIKEEGL